jgi:hypothetical protein
MHHIIKDHTYITHFQIPVLLVSIDVDLILYKINVIVYLSLNFNLICQKLAVVETELVILFLKYLSKL